MSAIGGPTHPIGDPQRIFELIKSCKEEGFQNKEDGKRAAAMALAAPREVHHDGQGRQGGRRRRDGEDAGGARRGREPGRQVGQDAVPEPDERGVCEEGGPAGDQPDEGGAGVDGRQVRGSAVLPLAS